MNPLQITPKDELSKMTTKGRQEVLLKVQAQVKALRSEEDLLQATLKETSPDEKWDRLWEVMDLRQDTEDYLGDLTLDLMELELPRRWAENIELMEYLRENWKRRPQARVKVLEWGLKLSLV